MTTEAISTNGHVTVNDVTEAAEVVRLYLLDVAQATKAEIREHCKLNGVSTELYQKALARMANQAKFLTEVSREDGSKAFEIKRNLRNFTFSEWLTELDEAHGPAKPREKYEGWYEAKGAFVLRGAALASCPVIGQPAARAFERAEAHSRRALPDGTVAMERIRAEDFLTLQSGYYASMFESACGMPFAPGIGSAKYRVLWDEQTLPASLLTKVLRPVPPDRPGGQGKGVTEVEALPPGTEIPFTAVVPGSHISAEDFAVLLQIAGRWVGFSPSASHKGWGRFAPRIDNVA